MRDRQTALGIAGPSAPLSPSVAVCRYPAVDGAAVRQCSGGVQLPPARAPATTGCDNLATFLAPPPGLCPAAGGGAARAAAVGRRGQLLHRLRGHLGAAGGGARPADRPAAQPKAAAPAAHTHALAPAAPGRALKPEQRQHLLQTAFQLHYSTVALCIQQTAAPPNRQELGKRGSGVSRQPLQHKQHKHVPSEKAIQAIGSLLLLLLTVGGGGRDTDPRAPCYRRVGRQQRCQR